MVFQFTVERPSSASAPVVIRLSGSMTLGPQLLEFSRLASDLLSSHSPHAILLEMSAVSNLDSAGLGELLTLYTTAGPHDCRVCLVSPVPRVIRILETTKLSGILQHFDSLAAATAWLTD